MILAARSLDSRLKRQGHSQGGHDHGSAATFGVLSVATGPWLSDNCLVQYNDSNHLSVGALIGLWYIV